MSFVKTDYKVEENGELHTELKKTIDFIAQKVKENIGEDRSVRLPDDHMIAFGGDAEKPELVLTFEWQKCFGKPSIVVSLDDKYIWQEWDFGTRDRLCGQIIKFLSEKLNGQKKD